MKTCSQRRCFAIAPVYINYAYYTVVLESITTVLSAVKVATCECICLLWYYHGSSVSSSCECA